jgi:hypothetical protein
MDGDLGVVGTNAAVSLVSVCQQLFGDHILERLLKEQQQNSITMGLTVRRLAVSVLFPSTLFCFCVCYSGLPNGSYIVCAVSKFFWDDIFYHDHRCCFSNFLFIFCYFFSFSKLNTALKSCAL